MLRVLTSAIILYAVIFIFLTVFQRKLIYYPYKLDKSFIFPLYVSELEEVFITCEDGVIINGLFAPGKENKPTVLIFHGNAGNITHRDFFLQGFHEIECSVLLIDYHGYGKSEGKPSEKNLYLDGNASLAWLGKEKKIGPGKIVLFGKSLGSGVAVELAKKNNFKGLILETPFSSTASVAQSHFPYNLFPVRLMVRDKFDNLSKIRDIHCSILFIQATHDEFVPKKEGEKLFARANMPKEVYIVDGAGHNTIQFVNPQKYWEKIATWINTL